MKKIIAILALFLAVLTVQAQSLTFGLNDFRKTYTGVAGDTLSSARLLTKSIYVDKDYFYHVNVQVEADSAGDASNVTAKLQGSWDNTTFYDIGSAVTWYEAAADTVFSLNSFTNTGTESTAAHYILAENAGGIDASDSLLVSAALTTVTKTVPGLIYPYLRVYFLGAAAGADMKLDKLRLRIIKAY